MKKKHLLLFWIFLFFVGGLSAQDIVLSVNSGKIGLYDDLTLTISLKGEANEYKEPRDLQEHFQLLGPPSTYSQTSIINGDIRIEKRYQYQLRPRRKGTFTLGPARARFDDEWVNSNTVEVQVLDQKERPADPNDPRSIAAQLAGVKVFTNKRKAYVGEPIVGRYVIQTQTGISRFESIEEPDFKGFLKEDIVQKKYKETQEVLDGKRVNTIDISQFVLIPQESGMQDPGDLRMRLSTQIPTNQVDWFGNRVYRTVDQVSESACPRIEVLPLPTSGRPAGFEGAVGSYQLKADLSRNEVKANESVTLTVELSGRGNIRLQDPPDPQLPPSLEAYDPKESASVGVNLNGMQGRKTVEYVIVPRYKGTYKIPSMTFSYFDPDEEKYVQLTTDELTIEVTTGAEAPASISQGEGNSGTSVDFLNQDILFIHTGPVEWKKGLSDFWNGSIARWIMILLLIGWFLILVWFRFIGRIRSAMKPRKDEELAKQIRIHLRSAKNHLRSNDRVSANLEILGASDDLLHLGSGRPATEVSEEDWHIQSLSDDENRILKEIRSRASMHRYAPVSAANMDRDIEELERLTKRILS
ncbi:MAG: BatD family protein [Bacteroidota bacterium]|nr:BatD family protein [Bacteroidota bacterium]